MEFIEKKAGELYTCSSGLSKSADQFGFGYPFLSYSDIFHNYYVPEELKTLVNSNEKDRKTCSVERGDVFLTRTSETTEELGMSCVALKTIDGATFNGFAKRLRPITDEIVPEYAAYFFRSSYFRGQCMSMASLITRASLNEGMISRLKIRFPKEKHDQECIGNTLMNYDLAIENNNKRIKILEQMAENLYKEWFVRFRFPGHEEVEFEGGIPKGWERKKLGEYVDIKRGGSPRPIQDYLSDSGLRWLKISDATTIDCPFIFEIKEHILESGLNKTVLLKAGELVLSNSATPGLPRIICVDTCIHDGWLYFEKSRFSKEYLYLFFKNERENIIQLGNGAIFTNLKTEILKEYKCIIPADDVLKNFQKVILPYFDLIKNIQQKNQNLINQRDLLLPRLMSGKLEI